jgi:hypothetical protein
MSVAKRISGKYPHSDEFPDRPDMIAISSYLSRMGFTEIDELDLSHMRRFREGISKNERYYEVVNERDNQFVKFWLSTNGIYTIELFVYTGKKFISAYRKICDTGDKVLYNDYYTFREDAIELIHQSLT